MFHVAELSRDRSEEGRRRLYVGLRQRSRSRKLRLGSSGTESPIIALMVAAEAPAVRSWGVGFLIGWPD